MSRSISIITMGTHKVCGGKVRFCYTIDKFICDECGAKLEKKDVDLD